MGIARDLLLCMLAALASSELTEGSSGLNMELSAVGERVFAAESIIKRRIRKVIRTVEGRSLPVLLSVFFICIYLYIFDVVIIIII